MRIVFATFLMAFALFAQGQNETPSFREVVHYYTSNYPETAKVNSDYFVGLQKRAEGWYITTLKYDANSMQYAVMDSIELWSAKKMKYNPVVAAVGFDKATVEQHLSRLYALDYDRHAFFGYPQWATDVIAAYDKQKDLSDDDLYGLARAWSHLATHKMDFDDMQVSATHGTFSKKEMNDIETAGKRAISLMKELHKRNPDYQTFIGNIHSKYSCEVTINALYFDLAGIAPAKKSLSDDLFNPALLSMAKNYLISCDPNAILITSGDLEYLPIYYLQEKFGYRSDIVVVNKDLLNIPMYAQHIYNKLDAAGGKHQLSETLLSDNRSNYIIVNKNATIPGADDAVREMNASDVFKAMNDGRLNTNTSGGLTVLGIPHKKLRLGMAPGTTGRQTALAGSGILLNSKPEAVMYRNDLVILDIIHNNIKSKPIAFSHLVMSTNYLGLKSWSYAQGVTNRLQEVANRQRSEIVHEEKTTDLLLKHFTYEGMGEKDEITCSGTRSIVANIRHAYVGLAEHLIREKKYEEARKVIDYCFTALPGTTVPHNYSSIQLANLHHDMKQDDFAAEKSELIFGSLEHFLVQKHLSETEKNEMTGVYQYLLKQPYVFASRKSDGAAFLKGLKDE